MKLIINQSEYDELIKLRVLKPSLDNDLIYELETKNGKIVYTLLDVNEDKIDTSLSLTSTNQVSLVSTKLDIVPNVSNSLVVQSKLSDEEIYKLYRDAFPIDTGLELGYVKSGISLRTGNKAKIISKLKSMIDNGLTIQEIVAAVKLDVSDKKQATLNRKDGENQLNFMKRMESWINQTATIESLVERLKNVTNTNTTQFKTNTKLK